MKLRMAQLLLFLLMLAAGIHVLALSGVIPYENLWGGRLTSRREMLGFETVALILNLIFMAVIFVTIQCIRQGKNNRFIQICLAAMSLLFLLNTLGNITAQNAFEKYAMTPVTLLMAVGCGILALGKSNIHAKG